MRADRLIAMLMLLQSRGQMTACELAIELEVSERTIYRDVNALCYSGVPVYTERGPGGGISLIERYRSDLTGLTKDEVRALFVLSIPPAITDLGLGQDLRAAMLKLSASLPATLRGDEQRMRQRIHIDPIPWQQESGTQPKVQLQIIQKAVWDSLKVDIRYQTFITQGLEPIRSIVCPYGLIAKATHWYMVGKRDDHLLVLRVDRIQEIHITGESFDRPMEFNLLAFWERWCQDNDANRPFYPVLVRVSPAIFKGSAHFLGERIQNAGEPDETGWVTLELGFEYHDQARSELLHFGGAIEVLTPVALRYSMKDYAEQILMVYTG
jgi:predicted DNA-binding transcriptional regulator YafY